MIIPQRTWRSLDPGLVPLSCSDRVIGLVQLESVALGRLAERMPRQFGMTGGSAHDHPLLKYSRTCTLSSLCHPDRSEATEGSLEVTSTRSVDLSSTRKGCLARPAWQVEELKAAYNSQSCGKRCRQPWPPCPDLHNLLSSR